MKLEPKSSVEVYEKTDLSSLFPGKARMIQLIKDTYPILKDKIQIRPSIVERFAKGDFRSFFAEYVYGINKIKTESIVTDISYNAEENTYRVLANVFHDISDNCLYYISVSFLPELKLKDKLVHDIILECLRIISSKGVHVFDEYYQDADLVDDLCSENDNALFLKDELDLFNSHGSYYMSAICCNPNISNLKKMIKKLPGNQFSKSLIDWVNLVLEANDEKYDIEYFCEWAREVIAKECDCTVEELFDNGNPVELDMCMRILWYESREYLEHTMSYLGEMAGNFDSIVYHKKYECKSSEDYNKSRDRLKEDVGLLPEKLAEILSQSTYLISDLRNIYKIPENGNQSE